MKTNTSNTSTPNSLPVKKPIAQVIEDALATVTELPWFESFHAGKHTDSASKTHTFSREDLQQMVNNFTAGTVPFLTGHPTADAPAYGFAKDVRLSDDDKLYLTGDNVDIAFAESVIKGQYGKRSIGIEFNKEKGWYIDHVAFLGATKPALNLQPVGEYKFAAKQEKPTSFDFSIQTQTANTLVRLMQSIRDYFLENEGDEVANKIIDKWDMNWLKDESVRHEIREHESLNDHLTPLNYSKPNNPAEDDMFTQAQLDEAAAKAAKDAVALATAQFNKDSDTDKNLIAQLEKQNAEMLFGQQVKEHGTWISKQISDGKLLPAQATGMAEFMAHIDANAAEEGGKFTFSQGEGKDAKNVTQSPVDFFKAAFEKGGKHTLLDNIDDDAPAETSFDSPEELNEAVLNYQKSKDVSYSVALDAVTAGAK